MLNTTSSQLSASRARKFCDEDGVLPAIEAAIARGALHGYATAEHYLLAVLEGDAPDSISSFGWQACSSHASCQRRGRCLRQDMPHGPRQTSLRQTVRRAAGRRG